MDIDEKKYGLKNFFICAFLFCVIPAYIFGVCYIKQFPMEEIIRNVIVAAICGAAIVIGLVSSIEKNSLLFTNKEHLGRFFAFFLLGLVFVSLTFYLPAKIWPIMFLAAALALTSNGIIGMTSYMSLLIMIALLTGGQAYLFSMNALIGLVTISLFKDLDYEFRYSASLLASLVTLFVLETAFFILFENTPITVDTFVLPLVNVLISMLFMLGLLKYYSKKVVHVYRDKYQEINDPEYELLAQLKSVNPEAYFHAIHTAYLSDKISRKIGADHYLAKGGGYFHQIGIIRGESISEFTQEIASEYKFPPELQELLKEYAGTVQKKETAVVYFADAVISSISFVLEQDKNAVLNYESIINLVFQKKGTAPALAHCNITIRELTLMKQLFIEEKLYYDFLR